MRYLLLLSLVALSGCCHIPSSEEYFRASLYGRSLLARHEVICFQGNYDSKEEKVVYHSMNAESYWAPDYQTIRARDCKTGVETIIDVHGPWQCHNGGPCGE